MSNGGDAIHLSFFASAFRDSPAPTVILSAAGDVLFWNLAAERAFGWTEAEVIGGPLPFIPKEKMDEHRAMRKRDLEGDGFVGRHITRQTKDGSRIDLSVSTAPIRDDEGRVSAIMSVYTDITSHKAEEESLRLRQEAADRRISDLAELSNELRRQQSELRLVIDGVPGMVAYIDRNYRYRFVNRGYASWFDRPLSDFEGRTITEALGEDWFEDLKGRLDEALEGKYVTFERALERDGTIQHLQAKYVPDTGNDGATCGLVVLIQDVTEQRRAVDALRNSEERFRRIVEIAAEGIWIVNQEMETTFVNPRMAEILGYSPAEIIGRTPLEFLHRDDRRRAVEGFRQRVAGDASPKEYRGVRKDGSVVWLDYTATPMRDESGALVGVLAMCTDVTDRKHADQQLRQTQKLESIGILAGGIAHDFNNLLVGILGNASLAVDTLPEGSPAVPMLRDVVAASERAAHLTRQLLAYAGKEDRTSAPTDVSALIRDLSTLLRTSIPKLVEISLDLDEDVPLVLSDHAQLQQVLMNLVINGAEAIPENTPGTVAIHAERRNLRPEDSRRAVIPVPAAGGQEYVAISVRDTGCGMDEATQSRIFDPFFTTKFDGRGLGLSAVLGIVRSHHGTVTIETSPGQGTCFTVLLPAAPPGAVLAAREAGRPTAPGRGTVLVVDDEQVVRDMAKRALELKGYTVLLASDGNAAIEQIGAHPEIRAMVLDFAMSRLGGDQAATQIRQIRPSLPILLSSGYSRREIESRVAEGCYSGFLQKPYSPKQLIEILGRLISRDGGQN